MKSEKQPHTVTPFPMNDVWSIAQCSCYGASPCVTSPGSTTCPALAVPLLSLRYGPFVDFPISFQVWFLLPLPVVRYSRLDNVVYLVSLFSLRACLRVEVFFSGCCCLTVPNTSASAVYFTVIFVFYHVWFLAPRFGFSERHFLLCFPRFEVSPAVIVVYVHLVRSALPEIWSSAWCHPGRLPSISSSSIRAC